MNVTFNQVRVVLSIVEILLEVILLDSGVSGSRLKFGHAAYRCIIWLTPLPINDLSVPQKVYVVESITQIHICQLNTKRQLLMLCVIGLHPEEVQILTLCVVIVLPPVQTKPFWLGVRLPALAVLATARILLDFEVIGGEYKVSAFESSFSQGFAESCQEVDLVVWFIAELAALTLILGPSHELGEGLGSWGVRTFLWLAKDIFQEHLGVLNSRKTRRFILLVQIFEILIPPFGI